jgi:hypothetical protein
MSLFRRFRPTPLGDILDPGLEALRQMSPRELAQYKAGWRPETEQWLLADAEQRRREGWSGPVKLSLFMSFFALVVALIALFLD